MSAGTMHVDEVDTNVALVVRLLTTQFPQWADLPIAPVQSAGTDNALYRLGDDMVVRFPRIRLEWDEYGQASGTVAVIDPPHRFAFRWRVHGVAHEEPLGRTASWMAAVTEQWNRRLQALYDYLAAEEED